MPKVIPCRSLRDDAIIVRWLSFAAHRYQVRLFGWLLLCLNVYFYAVFFMSVVHGMYANKVMSPKELFGSGSRMNISSEVFWMVITRKQEGKSCHIVTVRYVELHFTKVRY